MNAIHTLADELIATRPRRASPSTGLREIAFEAHRGGEIVRRLVSLAKVEQSEARPLDISAIDRAMDSANVSGRLKVYRCAMFYRVRRHGDG